MRRSFAVVSAALVVAGTCAVNGPGAATAAAPTYAVKAVAGPSYTGTFDAKGGCTAKTYNSTGFTPTTAGRYPLFLVLHGTEATPGTGYDKGVNLDIAREMAGRGFHAISVGYDNGYGALFGNATDQAQQRQCILNPTAGSGSLVAKACALPTVDCSKGIGIFGHSQGAYIALKASDIIDASTPTNRKVKAVVATGIGQNVVPYSLPKDRVRVLNGQSDFGNGTTATLNAITGLSCTSTATPCLRANGSGWAVAPGGHNWMQTWTGASTATFKTSATTNPYNLTNLASWADDMVG